MTLRFPENFLWGVSTSSYQIEGGAPDDGRGRSIWDTYCATPGKVANGDTGEVACDHYHRYPEDLDLLRDLGAKVYRLSIMWPRVLPEGGGRINEKGLDFYDRIVDGVLERGMRAWPCLYHWDLPQALQDRGGWTNRDIAGWFTDYTALIARRLGDRVENWVTFNEPSVSAWVGHEEGRHAPGLTDPRAAVRAAHHLNLAHGRAVAVLRDLTPRAGVGTVIPIHKARPLPQFQERDAHLVPLFEDKWNGVFLDPIYHGRYPASLADRFAEHVRDGDLAEIHRPIDFVGVNQYFPSYIQECSDGAWPFKHADPPLYFRRTEMNWAIDGHAFYEALMLVKARYGNPPVYVTENGGAFIDVVGADGRVDDQDRIAYYREYLIGLQRAISEGADVRGFMPWSLLDNFEWARGYAKRFGLVHVDYRTQKRTPKASFHFMREVIAENALPGI
ncbi:Beta-glucosidase [Cystobacter fuscus DSM 2262]|uniref:Beta-glucosidase n=1 Tax=Cystobacter fuscus (strain ATCC 25194 / DSM 2262 / NBRC 100088 / M29) TaxID=1242864 RepID=S9QDH2_CYSF2|nr:GH1 family beta-glucosidase [Cystobacter fuscus]EPX59404.1 Beta-glucosidase [Cystobacter fuscus DSM 2262]